MRLRDAAATTLVLVGGVLSAPAEASRFQSGDIFAAVGDANLDGQAEIFHYRADGTFVETLPLGAGIGGRSTGMAFDESGYLLATGFDASKVVRFDNQGKNLGVLVGAGLSFPESIVFDGKGNFYVSSVLSPVGIKKFDPAGNLLAVFIPGTRVDWMDLAADQRTMLFTQERSPVLRVDVSSSERLGDFAATGGISFALRMLADGRVLVANGENIKLFDSVGALIRTYDVAGEDLWFAVNINDDRTSFWSGSIQTGKLFKFDIVCGGVPDCTTYTQMIATGVPNEQPTRALAGLAIYGEVTASCPTCEPGFLVPELAGFGLLLGSW
jgi:hypothetical protein